MGIFGKRVTACSVVLLCAILLMRRKEKDNIVLTSISEGGYEGQLHHTVTEDGYILGLHRILRYVEEGKNETRSHEHQFPILFVHGLESTALDWINYQGKKSLPYLLLEEGYDVWLGNVRGTQASLNHTKLDPYRDPEKFWDSSIHEIGYYDLPAMIDYVLNTSNSEKLFYVGVSQGEATFLIMASSRPEYNEKIQLALLTSPSSHLKHSDNAVLKSLGAVWPVLQVGAKALGIHKVPGRAFLGTICQYQIFSYICNKLYDPFVGYSNMNQYDSLNTARLFQVYPINSALKQLLHYLQIYNSGIFKRYDYGAEENLNRYGTIEPPEYDLQNITSPIAYFWGENDCWSRPKDVEELSEKLPNLVLNYPIPHESFNHYDVFLGKDAKTLIYDKIVDTIIEYTKNKP